MSTANDQYNDLTNDSAGSMDLNTTGGLALLLTGTLSATVSVNDVLGHVNDDVFLRSNDETRRTDVSLRDPLYYIRAPFQINEKITLNSSGEGTNDDDSWTMEAITLTKANATSSKYNLPNNGVTIDGGLVNLKNEPDSTDIVTHNLQLTLNVNNEGDMTASANFGFADVQGSITEDLLKAQKAYWDIDTAKGAAARSASGSVNAGTVDTLSATLTANDLDVHFNDEIAAEVARWNGKNTISDWTISFDAVGNDVNTNLSLFARKQGATSNDVFDINDQIITSEGFDYRVSVADINGVDQVVVPKQKVYGVLYQSV